MESNAIEERVELSMLYDFYGEEVRIFKKSKDGKIHKD